MLYKRVVCVLYFSKEQNNLIAGKRKLEEQLESSQSNILEFTSSQYALLLANGSCNNELRLTMKYLDVTQATTTELISKINKLRQNYSK